MKQSAAQLRPRMPPLEGQRPPLRLLLIEDSEQDARFVLRHLRRDGREVVSELIDTPGEMAAALEGCATEGVHWDAVICDYFIPGFGAPEALALLRATGLDIPFIVVSGSVGEETAVATMRAGAHDYIMKDNLTRLGAAIEREMRDAENREEKRRAEEALREAEEQYRSLFENSVEGIFQTTVEGRIKTANPALARILGYDTPQELISSITNLASQVYADPSRREELDLQVRHTGIVLGFEFRALQRDGNIIWLSMNARAIHDEAGEPVCYEGAVEDITGRKRAEEDLRESEQQFRATFEQAAIGMAHISVLGRWLRVNRKLCEMLGYEKNEMLGVGLQEVTHPEDLDADHRHFMRVFAGELGTYSVEKRYVRKDGRRIWVNQTLSAVRAPSGQPRYLICLVEDITERKLAELLPEPLSEQEQQVLCLLARGKTNSIIAAETGYSLGGLKHHVHDVLRKLGASNRKEAAHRAVEIGLLPPR